MNNYTDLLRQNKLKVTPQRIEIINILTSSGHASIDLLYEKMLKKFKSISLATIYKNINLMLENSFVEEVKIPHSKSVFELTKVAHSHLVCQNCSHVEDIFINMENILEQTKKSTNFKINSASIVFTGTCRECA